MFRKSILIGLVVILVVGIAAVALAAPNRAFTSPLSKLNLTDEQYSKLQEADGNFFSQMQTLRNKMMEKTQELRSAYLQKDPDEKVVEKLEQDIALIEDEMRQLHQNAFDGMSDVLTDEQLEELKSSREAGFGRRSGYGGMGSGMMGFGQRRGFCHGFGRGGGMMGW